MFLSLSQARKHIFTSWFFFFFFSLWFVFLFLFVHAWWTVQNVLVLF
jgi:hypothetical protein